MTERLVPPSDEGHLHLLRHWLFFAVSALGIAGAFAFLAVLTRTPAVQILHSAEGLHRAIAGHVTFSLLVWLLAFEAVLWIVAAGPAPDRRRSWWGLGLMVAASGFLIAAVLSGRGVPILTDYVSVVVDPLFFVGLLALAVGVGLVARDSVRRTSGRSGLLSHGMRCAGALAALAVAACLVTLVRLGATGRVQADFLFFQSLFWMTGHLLQFVNVVAMVSVWYRLLESGFGVVIDDGRLPRLAFRGYVILAGLLFAATVPMDPRALPANLQLSVIMGLSVAAPTLIHIGIVTRAIVGKRGRWTSPDGAALLCSLALFTGGVVLALARARTGSTMWIPAHYHAVVVGGVTMAFMGLTYRLLVETGEIAWRRLAAVQPWLYGVGMLMVVVGMNWAGSSGAPRKTFDPALGATALRWVTPMNLMGLGGVVAVLGGAAFVVNALWSLGWASRSEAVQARAAAFSAALAGRRVP